MLQNKVLKTIQRFELLSSGDKVLIGVSGGADSLALLCILKEASLKLGIKIVVGHLNHGIRGKAAGLDEVFVKNVAQRLGLDFYSKKVKWTKTARYNEEDLRKLRYDFLFDLAKKNRITKIALAHTLDDQAETVLMRLIRGTGLYGLISIVPKRKRESFIIIRPMIEISRAEIDVYLKSIKVKPRIDKTNFSKQFLRNRIRHEYLEDLKKINPNIKETLARFAQQAAIDYDYLREEANRLIVPSARDSIKIELGKFDKLHQALQRMVIRLVLERISGELRTFTNKHCEEIQDLIKFRPVGSIVNLTKKIIAKKEKEQIVFNREK